MPDSSKDEAAKADQKNRDARWTAKYSKAKVKVNANPSAFKPIDLAIPMFGYKHHISIDCAHGLICPWHASVAKTHDRKRVPGSASRAASPRACG